MTTSNTVTVMTQHQAVIAATQEVLGAEFQEGVDIKCYITKEQRAAVVSRVTEMLGCGDADLSVEARAKFDTEQKLKNYTAGMVTNWFNKSKHLNGGIKYETKNPGSRAGAGNDQLKALKALRANLEAKGASAESIAKVDVAILGLLTELKAKTTAAKLPEINMELIPQDLRDLISDIEEAA